MGWNIWYHHDRLWYQWCHLFLWWVGTLSTLQIDCSDTTMMSFIWLLLNVRFFLCVWNRVDLWALGCIIYHMLEGRPPYKADTEYLTFQKVLSREFVMPSHFSPAAKDLINRLLVSLWLAPFKELSILVITLICMQCLFPVNAVKMLKYKRQL